MRGKKALIVSDTGLSLPVLEQHGRQEALFSHHCTYSFTSASMKVTDYFSLLTQCSFLFKEMFCSNAFSMHHFFHHFFFSSFLSSSLFTKSVQEVLINEM